MEYQRGELLYEGKAKKIFKVVGTDQLLWQEFKDSLTAFNGAKKTELQGKRGLKRSHHKPDFQLVSRAGGGLPLGGSCGWEGPKPWSNPQCF